MGPAGTARAYARVLPGTSPTLDVVRHAGFTGVRHVSTGVYCLTASGASGADERKQPAAVTVDLAGTTTGSVDNAAFVVAGAPDCSAGPPAEFEVKTYTGSPPTLDDRVAFTIVIP